MAEQSSPNVLVAYEMLPEELEAEIDWIAIPILTAVAYQNTPQGYQAEDEVMARLEEEYGDSMPRTQAQRVQPEANQGELL